MLGGDARQSQPRRPERAGDRRGTARGRRRRRSHSWRPSSRIVPSAPGPGAPEASGAPSAMTATAATAPITAERERRRMSTSRVAAARAPTWSALVW